jgi:hypothetical protein
MPSQEMSDKSILGLAASDIRYLVNRGYTKESSIRFVADHYRLPLEDRFVLSRVVVPSKIAEARQKKLISLREIHEKDLVVDGYNVLITTESLLGKVPVYICDDGLCRDTRGIFRRYRASLLTIPSLREILDLLVEMRPASVSFLLDEQISMSGELAAIIRGMISERELPGTSKTAKNVDRLMKTVGGIVATGDGNIVDAAKRVVDLPKEIAKRRSIQLVAL